MELDIWGAERHWLENYLMQRAVFLAKRSENETEGFFALGNEKNDRPNILSIEGDTASIKIEGRLNRNGASRWDRYVGNSVTAYRDIIEAAKEVQNNTQVKNVNLLMDTPGGIVRGGDEVWKVLMSLRKGRKLIAVNRGLMASMGYYLASAAHEIHSTSEANETGSIGVMVAGTDWSKYDEKLGIKDVVIVSKNAPEKYADISTDKGKKLLQDRVDEAEAFFMDRVSKGRGLDIDYIKENFGRGGLLVSKSPEGKTDALSVKMIDKVEFFSEETGGTPPVSVNTKQEDRIMTTLSELLAANPGAQAEYDRMMAEKDSLIQKAKAEGFKEGEEAAQKMAARVFGFMGEDSNYSQMVKDTALEVLQGKMTAESLMLLVKIEDRDSEKKKSAEAQKETAALPETPATTEPPAVDGKIETQEQLAVKQAELRKMRGLPALQQKGA